MRKAIVAATALALPMAFAVGVAPPSLADGEEVLVLTKADYKDKLFAMWQAECIANWTGLQTEGHGSGPASFYTDADWPGIGYVLQDVWGADDDTDIEYSYLNELAVEAQTVKLAPRDIAHMWNTNIQRSVWIADALANVLMGTGALPPSTSLASINEHRNMIDVQLVVEFFGSFTPGRPDLALDIAQLPIRTVAGGFGTHAGQFEVIAYALAPLVPQNLSGVDQVRWLITEALKYLPETSTNAQTIQWVLDEFNRGVDTRWEQLRDKIYQRFQANAGSIGLRFISIYESRINLAAQIAGLLWGAGDLSDTIRIGTLMGWDSDNPTASNAGLIGLMRGSAYVEQEMHEVAGEIDAPFTNFSGTLSERYNAYRTRDHLPDYLPADGAANDTFTLMAERAIPLVDQAIEAGGGTVTATDWTIPLVAAPTSTDPADLAVLNPDMDIYMTSANNQVRAAGGSVMVNTNMQGNTGLYVQFTAAWTPPSTALPNHPVNSLDIEVVADGAEADTLGREEWNRSAFFTGRTPDGSPPVVEVTYTEPITLTGVRLIAGDVTPRGGWIDDARVQVRSADGSWSSVTATPNRPIDAAEPFQQVDVLFASEIVATGVRVTMSPRGDYINLGEIDGLAPPRFASVFDPPEQPRSVDFTGLQSALAAASVLQAQAYSAESWPAFAVALASAQTLFARVQADPDSVDNAELAAVMGALRNAVNALVLHESLGDVASAREELSSAVARARGYPSSAYTPASWTVFAQVLAAAQALSGDRSATAAALRQSVRDLTWASIGLVPAIPTASAPPAQAPAQPAPPLTPPAPVPSAPAPPAAPEQTGTAAGPVLAAAQRSIRLVAGTSVTLQASAYTATGAPASVSWKSAKPGIVQVSKAGKVTAKKAGTARITASAGGKSVAITVKVAAKGTKAAKASAVTVTRVPKTMAVGDVGAVRVTVTPRKAIKAVAKFASSNTTVVSVDKAGRLVAKSPGVATITVSVHAKKVSRTITVK